DVVDVYLFKNKKDWAEGWPLYFKEYSANRVEPFCGHFGVCGGCQWQMLPYEQQLMYKQKQVADNLKRIGKVALPEILPIVGCDDEPVRKKLLDYVLKQFPEVTTLLYTINPKMNDTLNGVEPVTYYGKGYIIEKLQNFQFKISPKSFFQTNTKQAENLYRITK